MKIKQKIPAIVPEAKMRSLSGPGGRMTIFFTRLPGYFSSLLFTMHENFHKNFVTVVTSKLLFQNFISLPDKKYHQHTTFQILRTYTDINTNPEISITAPPAATGPRSGPFTGPAFTENRLAEQLCCKTE
jgi:hypothetical protein